ncbi:MAG: hypothetical protein QXG98_04800 [Candidatus Micrarchaeia archaeon]
MLVLRGRKAEVLAAIAASPEATEAILKAKPSIPLLTEVVGKTKISTLLVSPALLARFPKKALPALEKIGVTVKTIEAKRGRPRVHPAEKLERLRELAGRGLAARAIAQEAGLPLRTVYYYLRKLKRAQTNP